MAIQFTFVQFSQKYPTSDVVLAEIFKDTCGHIAHCPDCEKETKWHRIAKRPCYGCQWCGYRIFPLASTPLANTKLPLTHWYYVIFLFSVSRHGVSAKEIERQLGVSYKTAFRMGHIVREMIG
jgi:transposase-like protein